MQIVPLRLMVMLNCLKLFTNSNKIGYNMYDEEQITWEDILTDDDFKEV